MIRHHRAAALNKSPRSTFQRGQSSCLKTRFIRLLAFLFFSSIAVHAQDFERIAPKLPSRPDQTTGEEPTPARPALPQPGESQGLPQVKGLVFVPSTQQVRELGASGEGVQVRGVPLLENPEFSERMDRYLGQPVSFELVTVIAQDVVAYCAEQDHPVVNVTVPEQDVTSGVIQFVVVEGLVGQVRVEGNRWFRTSVFRNTVRLHEGDSIRKSRLDGDIEWLNNNPFRSVNSVLTPGTEPGTTDVIIRVDDRFPLRVYTGYENTGTILTDENRAFAGFNWGNAFSLDHILNYQYTASPDFEKFNAHSASYVVPLPWRHTLTVFGAYATTQPVLPIDFALKGESSQASARYAIPLSDIGEYSHEVSFGYDFKSTNNNLQFGGIQIFDTTAHVSQFVLGYNAQMSDRFGGTALNVNVFFSPGGMTSENDDANFDAIRAGADSQYTYVRAGLDRLTRLPGDFTWMSRYEGQLASGALLPTDQLGFGGTTTVRGYDELIILGDHGFLMTQEIRTPEMQLAPLLGLEFEDSLQFLAFWDYGLPYLSGTLPGQNDHFSLSSIGVGLRYEIKRNVSIRADYGWQLVGRETFGNGEEGRLHLSVLASF